MLNLNKNQKTGNLFSKISKTTGLITASILMLSAINMNALGDIDQRQAIIKDLKNKVEIKYGASLWREASLNQTVRPGTVVRTGSLSKVELIYPDGTLTRLGSRTTMTVLDKSIRAVKIETGKVWFKVTKKSVGYRVYSPTAVAAITGTEGFVEFGDTEKASLNNKKLASTGSSFNISEGSNDSGFSAGLVEGTMDVYRGSNPNGDLLGDPTQVNQGQIISFTGNDFNLQNVGINNIMDQNREISTSDGNPPNNNQNPSSNPNPNNPNPIQQQRIDPTNPVTEQVPSVINQQQDINNSPTTGDLEIIIK